MKNKRHEMILKLIGENDVETQEMLCLLLHKAGFDVTQATVSRDIKALSLIKVQLENGKSKYVPPSLKKESLSENGTLFSMLLGSVKSVDHAGNIAVIKCTSGMAQAICAKLDTADLPGIVGTIAGDDTIFILMRTEKDAERLEKELKTIRN